MALTPASILADYSSGIGTQGATLKVDANNERVGIGTTNPQGTLQVGTAITMGSGIVTATSFDASTASFSGNVSVGGVLTYEDVTSVDSVGIVTARDDIHVGGGLSVTGISTFNGITTSTTTLFANDFSVSGVSTLGGNVVVGGATTELVVTGDARVTGILTVGTASLTLNGTTGAITGGSLTNAQVAAINTSIVGTGTTVDVFVYDTRKDSDGGAWRKRTQHTSWYNETLNTATRGTRREFPSVAVIVAESSKVTIYDGDDPDMPMWMEFISTSGQYGAIYDGRTIISLVAKNGEISVADSLDSVVHWHFIADTIKSTSSSGSWNSNRNIKGRNPSDATSLWTNYSSGRRLVAYPLNDLAVTVLPNAPVDSATGLPVPTIAVATAGGVSVLKDDGTVVDITSNVNSSYDRSDFISISSDGFLVFPQHGTSEHSLMTIPIPSSDRTSVTSSGNSTDKYIFNDQNTANTDLPHGLGVYQNGALKIPGTQFLNYPDGLVILDENPESKSNAMVAYATTSYNTGWMHGDIKGAFLSGISTTSMPELVTNGTFDSNTNGWTAYHAVASVDSNRLKIDDSANSGSWSSVVQEVATVIGRSYQFRFTYTFSSDTFIAGHYAGSYAAAGAGTAPTSSTDYGTTSGTYTRIITATTTTTSLILSVNNDGVSFVDNVSFKLTEQDRSVSNKGLAVYGTITKSAVATGADLVGYSGFSNTNYLQQPYNSDLEFGTNDFSVTFWAYRTTGNTKIMFDRSRQNGTQNSRFSIYYNTSGSVDVYEGGGSTMSASGALPLNVWTQITFVKSSSQGYLYENGNLVAGPTAFTTNHNDASSNPKLVIGNGYDYTYGWEGSLALVRVSTSAPSATQIKKIYEDEKVLFQENAKATLYGSSDAVTALGFDEDTNLLHVGTSSGRSDFQGLRRINNTTTAVTTAISASNGLVAEE